MDPAIAHLDLDPPRESPWRRGLLPALLVNAVLLALLLGSGHWTLPWERPGALRRALQAQPAPMPAPTADVATARTSQPAGAPSPPTDDTARMGAPPAPPAPSVPPAPQGRAATAAPQPSFDCARARSTNERLICADPELARLDRALGALHMRARAAAPDPTAFQAASALAWRERERRCRDRDCLLAWFEERRTTLQAQLGGS